MSSIAMAADSTQSDLMRSSRRKAKIVRHYGKESRKQHGKVANACLKDSKSNRKQKTTSKHQEECVSGSEDSSSDCDSDLDLSKDLLPISSYIGCTEMLVGHMFRSISTKKLKAMLPEILKPVPVDQLKSLCMEQLEGMSKKRISRILDGDDPETISSSGTEDGADDDIHYSDADAEQDDNRIYADLSDACHADSTHYARSSAVERSDGVDGRVLMGAGASRSLEAGCAANVEPTLQSENVASESLIDRAALSDEREKVDMYDVFEAAAERQNSDAESEAEDGSEMDATPASLPSLASEPEDTCSPVKFLEMTDDGDIRVKKPDDDHKWQGVDELQSSHAAEVDSVHNQSSAQRLRCDDDALATAENENNMNIENESSNSNTDQAADETADRATDRAADETADWAGPAVSVENSENNTGLEARDEQDDVGLVTVRDGETEIDEMSGWSTAGRREDLYERTESAADDAILMTSCSAMIIDVQDHEFSDEETRDENKAEKTSCEPVNIPLKPGVNVSVQPGPSTSVTEERHVKQVQSVDSHPVSDEPQQKTQPPTRVIRLNRNFSHQSTSGSSTTQPSQKSADKSQVVDTSSSDSRRKVTTVCDSEVGLATLPTLHVLDTNSKLRQSCRKLATQTTLTESGSKDPCNEVLAVKAKRKLSRVSTSAGSTASTSMPAHADEQRQRTQQQVVERQESAAAAGRDADNLHATTDDDASSSTSLSRTQLEILELEMRARAIKAMIRAQEEMEQLDSAEKRRHRSDKADSLEHAEKQSVVLDTPATASEPRHQSSSPRHRTQVTSLQSVVGRTIIKRAEVFARRQSNLYAAQERFRPRKYLPEQQQRRVSAPAAAAAAAAVCCPRTVSVQCGSRAAPLHHYVIAKPYIRRPSSRVVRWSSARVYDRIPFCRAQRRQRFQLHGNLSSAGVEDKRRVMVASNQRSVRLSRPY